MAIAFFDMDKTVLAVNSGTLWVRRELALGYLSMRQALRASLWLTQYTIGFASAEKMVEEAVASIIGTPSDVLRERTRLFFEAEVKPTYRPGALEAIAGHRRAGDRLVMLTSSSNYLSELVGQDLGFDAVLCNRLEVGADGRHTGKVVGRVCFGAGKLDYAVSEAAQHQAPLSACTFYTDSFSDRAVMDHVGAPVAVNPDPRLRRYARGKGWRIADWGEPLRQVA